MQRILIQIN